MFIKIHQDDKHNCQFKLSFAVLYTTSSFIYYPGDFSFLFSLTQSDTIQFFFAVSFNLPHILLFHLYAIKSPHTI